MATTYGGRWRIIGSLGEGGQAQTFLVNDTQDGGSTEFVLKRLKNIKRIERFKREVEAIGALPDHPNIVKLIDANLEDQSPYLVTEYCAGGSLAKAEPFWQGNPAAAFRLFDEVCAGVEYAHGKGIVHRDLKPENILLRTPTGPAVVGDFGICFVEEEGRLTLTAEAAGPRLYIAPELEDGRAEEVTWRSDIYSLGKLLYWLFSGGRVFSREVHRERRWDLKGENPDAPLGLGWNNIYMEHVNRLLDLMVVANPEERRPIGTIRAVAQHAARLVEKEFTPIAPDVPKPCTYCGTGVYMKWTKGARAFGLDLVATADWRIYICNLCGHVQLFRLDMAKAKAYWG